MVCIFKYFHFLGSLRVNNLFISGSVIDVERSCAENPETDEPTVEQTVKKLNS